MKIIFSGGGTLGPVTPLLAVAAAYKQAHPDAEFIWVGTKFGPERQVVEEAGLTFYPLNGGKWRRYLSFWNIVDIVKIMIAFFQAMIFIWYEKPDLLVSAGGFVSVPLHWAGALLGIPSWVHQQDLQVGLANKLMFPVASKITAALEQTAQQLPAKKTEWIGNPSRELVCQNANQACTHFGIPAGSVVIFAVGGGTGSNAINRMILEALPAWPKDWHVIHLTGKERPSELAERVAGIFPNYHAYKFFTGEMACAYALATVVVARAGFATLTELAALSKPAIIVPMSGTHQEENASFFANNNGVVQFHETMDNGLKLAQVIKDLVEHPEKRQMLGNNLHRLLPATDSKKIVEIIDGLITN
jgi:UDP-N-acetylglucosamine--N-acetylmuramyl-(pentapeptide) pyrophosphoryl-undecaprenol N-acetylglucosamine transferase